MFPKCWTLVVVSVFSYNSEIGVVMFFSKSAPAFWIISLGQMLMDYY